MNAPLQTLKVLDFTQLLPGPFCSLLLADMGADVLKVEPPQGDALRWMPQLGKAGHLAFAYLNRNKRSLCLDLKQEAAIACVLELLREYDILIEGFRPGVMERLGLGYQTLSQNFPHLIYCSISGYGQSGPLAQKAGHDLNYLSRAGVASMTGIAPGAPIIPGVQMADLTGAHQAVIGILAAVIYRDRSGEGQQIDISLTDSAYSLLSIHAAVALGSGQNPTPGKMPLSGALPIYHFYQCADGKYLSVAALEPRFQEQLGQVLGVPLNESALSQRFREHTRDEWCEKLTHLDVCVEPVLNLQEAFHDPHLLTRKMVVEVNGIRQPGFPIHFSKTPITKFRSAPELGEISRSIKDQ